MGRQTKPNYKPTTKAVVTTKRIRSTNKRGRSRSLPQTAVHRSVALGLRVWFGQTRGMDRAHTHQDLEFNCVSKGWVSYFMAGRRVTIHAGHLAVIWGAMPHQTIGFSDDLKMAWGTLPLDGALLARLQPTFVEQLLGSGVVIDPTQCAGDWQMFERWQHDLRQNVAARRELVQREMDVRLLRLSMDVADAQAAIHTSTKSRSVAPTRPAVASHGVEHVQQMAAYISSHYTQPLLLHDITSQVPLHPNYAMTLFRQHTHMTLNVYLTRQRVAHAQRLLATTNHTIVSIGLDSGFGSSSRFFEAFKQHTACSPRAYRKQLTGR